MEQKVIFWYQKNLSGSDIAKKLGIHIRSVYRILEHRGIKRRSSSEQNKIKFLKSPLSFKFKQNLSASDKELLIAGTMLYYGEGAKTRQTVDLANSDLKILKIFLKFLRKICRVNENRLRFYLYCFSNQNPYNLIGFWCKNLQLQRNQFTKPYIRKANLTLRRNMAHGVLHVRYSDKRLLEKILSLITDITSSLI